MALAERVLDSMLILLMSALRCCPMSRLWCSTMTSSVTLTRQRIFECFKNKGHITNDLDFQKHLMSRSKMTWISQV